MNASINTLESNHKVIEKDEKNWLDDVSCNINTENDKHDKPCIAKLCFDNNIRPIIYDKTDYIPPYTYEDEDGNAIDEKDAFYDVHQYSYDAKEPSFGEILTGDEMECINNTDSVINVLKSTGVLNKKDWVPSLNTIKEESSTELCLLQRHYHDPYLRKESRKIKDRVRKLDKKITRMIREKGLYRVQLDTNRKAQHDAGANRSVTSMKHLLINYEEITPYPIGGVNSNSGAAIHCVGKGILPWEADNGEIILVKCFYCPDVGGTILSPTDIVMTHKERFAGWDMSTDCDEGLGEFRLHSRDGINHILFESYMENNLWFHYIKPLNLTEHNALDFASKAIVKKLTDSAAFELWHHRLGHPGQRISSIIHEKVNGVPKLRPNQFHSCMSCMVGKFKRTSIGKKKLPPKPISTSHKLPTLDKNQCLNKQYGVGEMLHMDFGFVRGSDWSSKDNDGRLVTSVDNF